MTASNSGQSTVSGRSARSRVAPSGKASERVSTLSASWLPRMATMRIRARVSRAKAAIRTCPVRKSDQLPSYRSPATTTKSTFAWMARSTRLVRASRVAWRMREVGASAPRPRSGLSRCRSAAWMKRKLFKVAAFCCARTTRSSERQPRRPPPTHGGGMPCTVSDAMGRVGDWMRGHVGEATYPGHDPHARALAPSALA